jgi:hypothetical protein
MEAGGFDIDGEPLTVIIILQSETSWKLISENIRGDVKPLQSISPLKWLEEPVSPVYSNYCCKNLQSGLWVAFLLLENVSRGNDLCLLSGFSLGKKYQNNPLPKLSSLEWT